jgi:hypothetical protein
VHVCVCVLSRAHHTVGCVAVCECVCVVCAQVVVAGLPLLQQLKQRHVQPRHTHGPQSHACDCSSSLMLVTPDFCMPDKADVWPVQHWECCCRHVAVNAKHSGYVL